MDVGADEKSPNVVDTSTTLSEPRGRGGVIATGPSNVRVTAVETAVAAERDASAVHEIAALMFTASLERVERTLGEVLLRSLFVSASSARACSRDLLAEPEILSSSTTPTSVSLNRFALAVLQSREQNAEAHSAL